MEGVAFWKPGTVAPGKPTVSRQGDEVETESELFSAYSIATKSLSIQQFRQTLPVFKHSLCAFNQTRNRNSVSAGPKPSANNCWANWIGQDDAYELLKIEVPQYVYEANWCHGGKVIACTQV